VAAMARIAVAPKSLIIVALPNITRVKPLAKNRGSGGHRSCRLNHKRLVPPTRVGRWPRRLFPFVSGPSNATNDCLFVEI
jgi:hypothetical protein